MARIENARINGTTLGVEDHGFLTAYITVEGPGWGCAFGGYVFDKPRGKNGRVGVAYGMEWIRRALEVVGVERWEDLNGKPVRVMYENDSKIHAGETIKALGNFLEDQWLDPKALAENMR